MLKFIFVYIIFSIYFSVNANEKYYEDGPVIATIKTDLIHPQGDPLGNPMMRLNSNDIMILKFDELTDEIQNYEYNIVACNSDWTESMMFTSEYIDGFQTNAVYDFRISATFNNTRYIHYWVTFPNNQFTFKKSGNYVVNVFKSGYPDSIILTKRFLVYEQLVEAEMYSQPSTFPEYYNTHQELRFAVDLKRLEVQYALYEIKVTLMQNFRWDNAFYNIPPVFVNENIIQFRRDGKFVFPAGKEFRYFDHRNMLINTERIKALSQNKTDSIYLYTDQPRKNETYRFRSDMNGRFIIGSYPWTSYDYEANYVYVVFTLQTNALYRNGDIYVTGNFSGWKAKPEYKMTYDADSKSYYAVLLLKQGFYNYIYAFAKQDDAILNSSVMEGDYFETENEYEILVYYRPTGARYDRLIAYKAVDSYGNQRK